MSEGGFERRLLQHRDAVGRLLADVEALDDARWAAHPQPDKWSPGQIAEHLLLGYEALLRELRGGVGIRLRATWWRRLWIRLRYLPMVLREGRLPSGAPAVREIRPKEPVRPRAELLRSLRERAGQFEEELSAARGRGGVRLTHPFFGRLGTTDALAFVAVHVEHHRRQLPNAAEPGT